MGSGTLEPRGWLTGRACRWLSQSPDFFPNIWTRTADRLVSPFCCYGGSGQRFVLPCLFYTGNSSKSHLLCPRFPWHAPKEAPDSSMQVNKTERSEKKPAQLSSTCCTAAPPPGRASTLIRIWSLCTFLVGLNPPPSPAETLVPAD